MGWRRERNLGGIADWLRGLGLEKYAPAFDENAINWDVLSELTTDDLKEIGVPQPSRSRPKRVRPRNSPYRVVPRPHVLLPLLFCKGSLGISSQAAHR